MAKFAYFLKSHAPDKALAHRLIATFQKFHTGDATLFISVPKVDYGIFRSFQQANVQLLIDEDISADLARIASKNGISPGYLNQQIIKLSFWKTGLAQNYLCLDSDGVFIRSFDEQDFMADTETPYTVLTEDKELEADPTYFRKYWKARSESMERIKSFLDFHPRKTLTTHGFTVLNARVLESMEKSVLEPRQLTYMDLLEISPYEFSWYNFFLQKTRTIDIEPCEPFFKVFHVKKHYLEALNRRQSEKDFARGYVGIVINSNWSRQLNVSSYGQPVSSPASRKFMRRLSKQLFSSKKESL